MNDYKSPWKITLTVTLVAVAIYAFLNIMAAHAGTITKHKDGHGVFVGDFTRGTEQQIARFLNANPNVKAISLNSNGGVLGEGVRTGRLFDKRKIDTHVVRGARCISACAMAFLGGPAQQLDGTVAFHNAARPDQSKTSKTELSHGGQVIGAYIFQHFLEMGYSAQLPALILMNAHGNRLMVFKNKGDLDKFYVGDPKEKKASELLNMNLVSHNWAMSLIKEAR